MRSGAGDGDGYGSGSGYGAGDGYGSGYGSGFGYGDGYGKKIGTVGALDVVLVWPGWVGVGCQAHSVAHWRERWRTYAAAYGVVATPAEVDALLTAAIAARGALLYGAGGS